jgi:O-methyltransferase involved in polyketide biosynthesis
MFRRRAPRSQPDVTVPGPRHGQRPAGAGPTAGRHASRDPHAAGTPGGSGAAGRDPGGSGAAGRDPGGSGAADRDPGGPPPPGLDVSTAHPARVWNYWLGGRDYFAADRAAGEQLNRDFPQLAQTARAERAFLVRAVRFLAGPARIWQFLDIGAGLPAGGNTHEIAQRIAPGTRIVYADNDQAVLVHARALLRNPMLASTPEGAVSYVEADLRDVTAVLAGAERTLDLSKPVALIMLGVLGYIDDHGSARSITSQLVDALPAGSYLAIADGVAGSGPVDDAQRRYNDTAPVPYHLRRPDQVASFFDGLDLVEPGVVPCPQWKPDAATTAGGSSPDEPPVHCGVARKL